MTSVIVDLQGFKLHNNNTFICKEIAVVDIESCELRFETFRPPFPWTDLDEKSKKSARWLTKNHHNLEWCSGNIPYINFEVVIQGLLDTDEIEKVYVKGEEKKRWLECISHKKIINLEQFNCPSLKELHTPLQTEFCNLHINNCAVRNVNTLRKWFKNKFNTFEAFKTFHDQGILNFMTEEQISQLPMEFVMIYAPDQINSEWYKFPSSWRKDEMFQKYQ